MVALQKLMDIGNRQDYNRSMLDLKVKLQIWQTELEEIAKAKAKAWTKNILDMGKETGNILWRERRDEAPCCCCHTEEVVFIDEIRMDHGEMVTTKRPIVVYKDPATLLPGEEAWEYLTCKKRR